MKIDEFDDTDPTILVPSLVERCREFEKSLRWLETPTGTKDQWRLLGIAESIHTTEERPQS
jgi:hypothetical protein